MYIAVGEGGGQWSEDMYYPHSHAGDFFACYLVRKFCTMELKKQQRAFFVGRFNELKETFGKDKLSNSILLLLRYEITICSKGEVKKKVSNGFYAGQADFEYEMAIGVLKANDLIHHDGNDDLKLGKEGHKLFETLPDKNKDKPYTYFRKRKEAKESAENRENWRKNNWLIIAITSSLLSVAVGLISGMYLERWKQRNPQEKKQQILPKSEDQISPTKPFERKKPSIQPAAAGF